MTYGARVPSTFNPFGCLYGPFGQGKTAQVIWAYPNLYGIGVPESIKGIARAVHGLDVQCWPEGLVYDGEPIDLEAWGLPERVETIDQLLLVMDVLTTYFPDKIQAHGCILVDDVSLLATASLADWDADAPIADSGNKDARYKYGNLAQSLGQVARKARHVGAACWMTVHAKELEWPAKSGNKFLVPDFGSGPQALKVPGWFEVSYRVQASSSVLDPELPVALHHDTRQGTKETKDRFQVAWEHTPASLLEVMRASPLAPMMNLERPDNLAWCEEITAETYAALRALGDAVTRDAVDDIYGQILDKYRVEEQPAAVQCHYRNAIQDGIARYSIRARASGPFARRRQRVKNRAVRPAAAPAAPTAPVAPTEPPAAADAAPAAPQPPSPPK